MLRTRITLSVHQVKENKAKLHPYGVIFDKQPSFSWGLKTTNICRVLNSDLEVANIERNVKREPP